MNKLFPQHSDHPLFRYFTDDERRNIEKIGEVKTISADGYLIRARETDSTLYTIEEGHLDIVAKRLGARALRTDTRRRGAVTQPIEPERL